MSDNPKIEQVGFVTQLTDKNYDFSVEMMGGEFCVNAARSAAFLYFEQTGKRGTSFKISGLTSVVRAAVNNNVISLFLSPSLFKSSKKIEEGWLIDLQGSRFIVTEDKKNTLKPKEVIVKYDNSEVPAIGLVYLLPIESRKYRINPWVYVRKTDTLLNESACGSGSIVACITKIENVNRKSIFLVIQPSGSLYEISLAGDNNKLAPIVISGSVDYLGKGALSE